MPLSWPDSEADFMAALISSWEQPLARRTVKSTTDTSGVGTRKAMLVSFPLSSGMTLPTALAAPVEEGMMFWPAPRPPRQSLPEGPSTVFCVAVVAWTVVMSPSSMPNLSLSTLATGARQLVVQEALDTIVISLLYFSSLTPITNMGASAEGAEMMTFLAPPAKRALAVSRVVNTPVDSTTYSAPADDHLMFSGFISLKTLMVCPSTTKLPPSALTSPLYTPWVESYLNMYTM